MRKRTRKASIRDRGRVQAINRAKRLEKLEEGWKPKPKLRRRARRDTEGARVFGQMRPCQGDRLVDMVVAFPCLIIHS